MCVFPEDLKYEDCLKIQDRLLFSLNMFHILFWFYFSLAGVEIVQLMMRNVQHDVNCYAQYGSCQNVPTFKATAYLATTCIDYVSLFLLNCDSKVHYVVLHLWLSIQNCYRPNFYLSRIE